MKTFKIGYGFDTFEGLPEDAINNEKIRKFYLGSQFNL